MLRRDLQTCPHCDGTIPREDFVTAQFPGREDTFIYCEFCGIGQEISVYDDGQVLPLDYHERTEPVAFGKFLQRLEDARVA